MVGLTQARCAGSGAAARQAGGAAGAAAGPGEQWPHTPPGQAGAQPACARPGAPCAHPWHQPLGAVRRTAQHTWGTARPLCQTWLPRMPQMPAAWRAPRPGRLPRQRAQPRDPCMPLVLCPAVLAGLHQYPVPAGGLPSRRQTLTRCRPGGGSSRPRSPPSRQPPPSCCCSTAGAPLHCVLWQKHSVECAELSQRHLCP